MSGASAADVLEALDQAAARGLVEPSPVGWVRTHDLVRQAALAVLTPMEAVDLHAAAATLAPDDDRPAAVARRAHHALAVAARSEADARRAIGACRAAAEALRGGFDFEGACALLASAVALAEQVSRPAGRTRQFADGGERARTAVPQGDQPRARDHRPGRRGARRGAPRHDHHRSGVQLRARPGAPAALDVRAVRAAAINPAGSPRSSTG